MQISSYLEYLRQDFISLKRLLNEWHQETGEAEETILELIVELLTSHSSCPLRTHQFSSAPPKPCQQSVPTPKTENGNGAVKPLAEGFRAPIDTLAIPAITTQAPLNGNHNGHATRLLRGDKRRSCSGCALQDLQLVVNRLKTKECIEDIQLSRRRLREMLSDINLPLPRILFPPQLVQPRNAANLTPTGSRRRRGDLRIVSLPSVEGLQWQDIKMTFISHESVRINAGPLQKRLHFAEMGFKDGRKGDVPDTRWAILREFAARRGIITWQDVNPQHSAKLKAAIKDIRKRLKAVFGISTDPFYPYRKVKGYKIKLQLDDETLDNNF